MAAGGGGERRRGLRCAMGWRCDLLSHRVFVSVFGLFYLLRALLFCVRVFRGSHLPTTTSELQPPRTNQKLLRRSVI